MCKSRIIILNIILFLFLSLFSSVSFAKNLKQGLNFYNTGNYEKAEKIFKQIILNEPNNYTAKYMLAITLVNRKEYNKAKQLYKNIIINSNNKKLISLSHSGLGNLGVMFQSPGQRNIRKAVLNVNTAGSIMIVNNVTLNNSIKTNFIFDTGATYTSISKKTASKLNISTRGAQKLRIMTGSGYINAPIIKIDVIEVNGLVVRDVEAVVMNLPMHS